MSQRVTFQDRVQNAFARAVLGGALMLPYKTRVRLVHSGLPEDAVSDHGDGWAHYLDRLAIVTTGGDAGADVVPSGD